MPADANVVKELTKKNLLGVFSEHDAEKRRFLIAKTWDTKAILIDAEGRYVGHTAINEAVEQLQHRFQVEEASGIAPAASKSHIPVSDFTGLGLQGRAFVLDS